VLRNLAKVTTRYLILKPSIMGMGVDVGRLIDDMAQGAREHLPTAAKHGMQADARNKDIGDQGES
jgi:hypothetical protein